MAEILMQKKRYEPKFLVSTFRNDATAGVFILLGILILKFAPFPLKVNLSISGFIVFFGVIFTLIDGLTMLKNFFAFRASLKNVSYYDSRMDDFIDVVAIQNSTAMRKDGSMIAYLKITPRDLSIMSAEEQQSVVNSYSMFLNSLEDHIQIVSRSVPVDLDTWLFNIENKISNRKDSSEYSLKRFLEFKKWIMSTIGEGSVRNRVFYIVIRYFSTRNLSGANVFIEFFRDLFGVKTSPLKSNIKSLREAFKELDDRVLIYSDILQRMGVGVDRLNDNEILSMFSGYSNDIEGIDTNYVTPMMWPSNEN